MIYVLLALGLVVVLAVGIYNSLIGLKNKCEEAWSDIDTQLKRRYDLIPNLVETVKGYAAHESTTLEKVTEARNAAINAKSVHDKEQAENVLTGALKTIFALAENYPDLKANQNFLDLQKTLKEIEEQIQLSRRYYNATARDLNTKLEVFPNNIIAKPFGFEKREFFQIDEEEKKNVKVDFTPKQQETGAPAPALAPVAAKPVETPKVEEKKEEPAKPVEPQKPEEKKEVPKPEEKKEEPKAPENPEPPKPAETSQPPQA